MLKVANFQITNIKRIEHHVWWSLGIDAKSKILESSRPATDFSFESKLNHTHPIQSSQLRKIGSKQKFQRKSYDPNLIEEKTDETLQIRHVGVREAGNWKVLRGIQKSRGGTRPEGDEVNSLVAV